MANKEKTVGIIGGTGLLGGIFSKVFERQGQNVLIAGRETELSYKDLVKKSDVIIFSVPIHVTKEVVDDVLPYTRKDQLLMDFTSIKKPFINKMLESEASVIGLHPMFGPVESIEGKTIIACPARPGEWMAWVKNIFEQEGAEIKITNKEKHDKIMSLLQGLMHSNFIVFGKTLKEASEKYGIEFRELLDYGGPIYEMRYNVLGRILGHDPSLYADIAIENERVKEVVDVYEREVKELHKIIGKKNKESFENYFKEAGKAYKGFEDKIKEESREMIELFSKLNKSGKEND